MQVDRVLLGGGGAISSCFFFSKSLTPSAVAASVGMKEENFTAMGSPQALQTTDVVVVFPPPAAVAANIGTVSARATAADAITLIYANMTAAANVATAGVHGFLVFRP